MTHTDLIARLRVKDRPLMQQGGFSSIRLVIREAADALTAAQEQIEALEGALRECEEALDLHGKMYPHMVKGYTLDALNRARAALNATGKGER